MIGSRFGAGLLLLLVLVACRDINETPAPVAEGESSTVPAAATEPPPAASIAPRATDTPQPDQGQTSPQTVSPSPAPVEATPEASGERGGADADVTFVRAAQETDGTWTFHVTVEHPDTGWEDYADGWDVVTPDGQVIKRDAGDAFTRELLHPHVNEQPFTRSQSGLTLPDSVEQVTVRAHDLLDGFGGREVVVDLSKASGPGFEIQRGGE